MDMRRLVLATLYILVIALLSSASAADFTQAERDQDFGRDCKRQDSKLSSYFGTLMPVGQNFCHLGGFTVKLHREGLERTLQLVPIKRIPYGSFAEFQAAARKEKQPVGYLTLTYMHRVDDILLPPGTHLLTYDGLQLEIYNVHNYMLDEQDPVVGAVAADYPIDDALGEPSETLHSLAQITPDGHLELLLQLSDIDGSALLVDGVSEKFLLRGHYPGIASDDDTPPRELAIPKDTEEEE